MRIDIDLTDVEVTEGFDPIPEGLYNLKIVEGEIKQSTSGKHPYLAWRLEVLDDPDFTGRLVFHNTSTSPKALGMPAGLKALWLALGLPLNDIDVTAALGGEFTADVELEAFVDRNGNQRMQNVVKKIYFED